MHRLIVTNFIRYCYSNKYLRECVPVIIGKKRHKWLFPKQAARGFRPNIIGVLVENIEEALTEAMKKYITEGIEYRTLIMNHITIMHRSSFIKMCVSPSSTQKTA
ncbi:hypothetical protein MKZ04_14290 [Bacillus sp. FSL W7-1354]|uniref:hypothetical protein n=1 Tax=Bacillus TaxID=1386 RepID=UPI00115748F9|nr:hypothetical protein [Bacillus paralicheniformis]KAA0836922.1 hypothetical protein EI977_12655 [Bacillus paralicheniformis]KAA0843092.1 hypothetical protein EI979_05880 [Bacillus paralicheniformis]